MTPPVDRATIRLAIEKARENFAGIEADHALNTPQTIALYVWLIDYEALNKIEPIDKLHRLFIRCLENQVVTRGDQEKMTIICCRFHDADSFWSARGICHEPLEL
ncbi:MAG: hypothetical protein WAK95_11395 [Desulfobacterales bacterium]